MVKYIHLKKKYCIYNLIFTLLLGTFFIINTFKVKASLEANQVKDMCDSVDGFWDLGWLTGAEDACKDQQKNAKKNFCKNMTRPNVVIKQGSRQTNEGNENMSMVYAELEGYYFEAADIKQVYFTWDVNGDYKYNVFYAGGNIKSERFGTLQKFEDGNGIYYKRIPPEGLTEEQNYENWVNYYKQIDNSFDGNPHLDYDQDGFQSVPDQQGEPGAPFGGIDAHTQQARCAYFMEEGNNWIENCDAIEPNPPGYSACVSLGGHEFWKLKAVCINPFEQDPLKKTVTGKVGDEDYNNCMEYTFGTDPLKAVTYGDETLLDGQKMTGAGNYGFWGDISDIADDQVDIKLTVEGRSTDFTADTKYVPKLVIKDTASERLVNSNVDMSVEVETTPSEVIEGGYFTSILSLVSEEVNDPSVMYYEWKVARGEAIQSLEDIKIIRQGYGEAYKKMIYPTLDEPPLNKGKYYIQARACKEDGTRTCGPWADKTVVVGKEIVISLEALIREQPENEFQAIDVVLNTDKVMVTASHSDGANPNDFDYVWHLPDNVVGVFDPSISEDYSEINASPNVVNTNKFVFIVSHEVALNQEITVDAIDKDGNIKSGYAVFDIQEPKINIIPKEGVKFDAGSLNKGQVVFPLGEVTTKAGPPGSTFEIKEEKGWIGYEWDLNGKTYLKPPGETLEISGKEVGDMHILTVKAVNIIDKYQIANSEMLNLEVVEKLAGVKTSNWTASILDKIGLNKIPALWWFVVGTLFFSGLGFFGGKMLSKRKTKKNKISFSYGE